ncbi:MBL fold metallo-hydrolase [Bacillus haynesii]|uniref:MBL fold metallo-hydrolase n=1 Tax=Bacillus haynesii TaxID=1925021 RepID=UPI001592E471|nr:MBL fold metallo-hydrolase [Bacillus haynesii]NVB32616.1 MBL fold metallo-hydrolase [Bacillus licheniformis]MCY7778466.1 MBL fold metallo-hydrolase [Bacillus haynesii]MCY8224576.1 MBL fold metallo-hydrolase [Bacillus haynesii]MEC0669419.1 MBL fold metallo-hydrolase [Bacillus haynesii]MEC1346079.1 MBL fold metallo-hydrolase [Bacillus haynesii]
MNFRFISPKEVTEKILRKESFFILDVRNKEAFSDWKIEGDRVEHLNVPYFDLIDGVVKIAGQVPKDKDVIVVCAKQGSSEMVAHHLVDAGFERVLVLKGGMKAWSEFLHPVKIGDLKAGGSIYQFVRMGKGCLSYFIENDGEAIVVDPARTVDAYIDFAKERNVTIKHVVDTHLHADHISGGRLLRERTGSAYYLPPKDAEEVQFSCEPLVEGENISVGNAGMKAEPIYSPGHTIGSTSLIIDNHYLLTGDILFVESIGRPDLAGKAGDWAVDLRNTLYEKYKQISDDLIVLPAHFANISELGDQGRVQAKLSDLYKKNAGLNLDENEFRGAVSENLPPQPNAYQEIRQTNMGKITPDADRQSEMEIGPNRCAVHG